MSDASDDRRVAIIGDVGGALVALRNELARLGVPERGDGELPDDLVVVQVGDLVHRGPDSPGVVELVDRHLRATPRRWIQLIGNHEAFYLRRPRQYQWDDPVPGKHARMIRRWWREGLIRVAAGVRAGGEDFVVTHAGLTRGFWAEVLGGPADATSTVAALNRLRLGRREALRPGTFVGWRKPDLSAGPIWAAAGSELVASWRGYLLPFSQLHGHSSVFDWDSRTWQLDGIDAVTQLDEVAKHAIVQLAGGRIIGVDPGHATVEQGEWRSLELVGSVW